MALAERPNLVNRMIRAARLDVTLYEEVEADETATGQAALVVLLVGMAGGLACAFSMEGHGDESLIGGLILGGIAALVGWRSEEHTSELQSQFHLVCRLLL